jgi:ferredoxin
MDCIEVCCVDAFYEGENMLVINPRECVDCGVCIDACPADAIFWDEDEKAAPWIELNAKYSEIWPNVTFKGSQTPQDAADYVGVSGKYEAYFSPQPGQGNVGEPALEIRKTCGQCKPNGAGSGFWNWLRAVFR